MKSKKIADNQTELFDGAYYRDTGMKLAVKNANIKTENWSEMAYKFMLEYIKKADEFMVEEVRFTSFGIIPQPPSKRAWGSIVCRVAKQGLIHRIGYRSVKNVKAHCTPATLWKVTNQINVEYEKY